MVKGCKDAEIDHNYIHHLQGDSGVAVFVSNATATIENNLLSQVNTVCSIFGETTDVTAKNNVLVSTSEKAFFNIGSSKTYDEIESLIDSISKMK